MEIYSRAPFGKLPTELIDKILSYTYQLQPADLLQDISHYYKSRKHILQLYYDIWIIEMNEIVPEQMHWLMNDLFAYSDQYINFINDLNYVYDYYAVFLRNSMLKDRISVDKYVDYLSKQTVGIQINVLWGLLNIVERDEFVRQTYLIYYHLRT
jgi:hypothetical protein